jgi:hypothetical protein
MCDCNFYLPQCYTGAAHQNLCSLNYNGGEGGAAHRNISIVLHKAYITNYQYKRYIVNNMTLKLLNIFILLFITFSVKGQNVYKTPTGSHYHLETCRMVENVSEQLTIALAIEKGLMPCKICKPPILKNMPLSSTNKAKGEQEQTTQCKAQTKVGNRCKHKTSIGNGFCFQHQP